MAKKALPCPTVLRQLLRYEAETGKLFWRHVAASHFGDSEKRSASSIHKMWIAKYAGKQAFTAKARGYHTGKYAGQQMLAHRVIWAICHGAWPVDQIDHINRVRHDNRIVNLRVATPKENCRNKASNDCLSDIGVGVHFDHRSSTWGSRIYWLRERISLGSFDTKEEAQAARYGADILKQHMTNKTETFGLLKPKP